MKQILLWYENKFSLILQNVKIDFHRSYSIFSHVIREQGINITFEQFKNKINSRIIELTLFCREYNHSYH